MDNFRVKIISNYVDCKCLCTENSMLLRLDFKWGNLTEYILRLAWDTQPFAFLVSSGRAFLVFHFLVCLWKLGR